MVDTWLRNHAPSVWYDTPATSLCPTSRASEFCFVFNRTANIDFQGSPRSNWKKLFELRVLLPSHPPKMQRAFLYSTALWPGRAGGITFPVVFGCHHFFFAKSNTETTLELRPTGQTEAHVMAAYRCFSDHDQRTTNDVERAIVNGARVPIQQPPRRLRRVDALDKLPLSHVFGSLRPKRRNTRATGVLGYRLTCRRKLQYPISP